MAKKYKCPYCQDRYIRKDLINHIDEEHEELIPDNFESAQVVYDIVNGTKGAGRCRVCSRPTKWNSSAKRYDVLCERSSCKQAMREEYQKNMLRVHGTYNILTSDEQQKKMLANRSISGKYKFTDGGVVTYTGSYEKKFLEFADKVMQIPSKDIMAPGPTIEYEMNGEKHFYITDFLYIPYNLIIEVKDGGLNPNNKNTPGMRSSRQRTIEKERLITNRGEYNYLRLTDNQFVQLLEIFMDIKKALIEGNDDKIVRINESYINESKSSIDDNYKPKGKKNLSSFKKVHITESVIDKYKKEYPFLKHVRCKDTEEYICDGYVWFNDDELVAMVGSCEYTDDKTKWIVSLEITKKYKGYGLSKQILDYAVKTMNCKYLSVNKNNEIAKKVYDDYGFKVYQESDAMYYMTIDKNFNESYVISLKGDDNMIYENLILNNKDLEINLDKFESGDINVLLVTGFSGSGKSTLAKALASKYKCTNYELDCLEFYLSDNLTMENIIGNEDGLVAFINTKKLKPKVLNAKELTLLYKEYIKFLINWCRKQKDKKFIIEGLQIYETYKDGDTHITSCPIIIKGTSGLVSAIRAAKRNDGSFAKEFGSLIKWALKDNKALEKLKKDLNESYLEESKVKKICTKCGSKDIGVYIQGEPIYKCNDCGEYLGTVPCKVKEATNIFTSGDFVEYKDYGEQRLKEIQDEEKSCTFGSHQAIDFFGINHDLAYKTMKEQARAYDQNLAQFTAYHLEPLVAAKNKKNPNTIWDEELYSKSIEFAIVNDIKDNYECKRCDRVSAYVYTAGRNLKPIYLGTITIFDKNNPNDWEWEEQEFLDKKTYDYLMKYPMVEATDISNFYDDEE